MDLIARKDFRNVRKLGLSKADKNGNHKSTVAGAVHDRHIHKGAVFSIGSGGKLDDCSQEEQELIAELLFNGCAGDASDTDLVKEITESIAVDKRREDNLARLDAAAANSDLVKQLTNRLKAEPATASKA